MFMRLVIISALVLISTACLGPRRWCDGTPLGPDEWCEMPSGGHSYRYAKADDTPATPPIEGRMITDEKERAKVIQLDSQKNACIRNSKSNDELITCLIKVQDATQRLDGK
jgi:hypothetical protein